jgi:2-methylcitrate dehydratase PrpD
MGFAAPPLNPSYKSREDPMPNETVQLAEYAAKLRYEDLPPAVVQRAKDTIADTVATILFGYDLPWSRIIVEYAKRNGAGGRSRILGAGEVPVHAPAAALANGAIAHAFEMDNLTQPNSGSHPGATTFTAALAIAQERGSNGRETIAATVAGFETMIRIGRATKHSNERRGFHAPGTTGPLGAAVACGRLMQFEAERMTNALGIAASTAGGLLEFARSGTGAMVKRLHLGRAAEGGVLAASLAADGFTGPKSAIEGQAGFLKVLCNEYDESELTRGLGRDYVTMSVLLKRFPAHITAHTPVQAIEELKDAHGFSGADVASISIAGEERVARVNNIPAPADLMMAQYSVPFCVALALYRDARDPASFTEAAVRDPDIRSLAARVTITVDPDPQAHGALASTVTVTLKDGRTFTRRVEYFKGTPKNPLNADEMREKFMRTTRKYREADMTRLYDRLQALEQEPDLAFVSAG